MGAFWLVAACAGPSGDPQPGDTSTGDSAPADDTAPPTPVELHGTTVLPEDTTLVEPLTAAAVLIRFGDGPVVDATLVSTPVEADGSFTLVLPEGAPEADLGALDPNADPVVTGALYAVLAFEDADGDGAWAEGETVRGLAMDGWLIWTDAWRLADLGMAGQYAANRCLLDTTVPLSWREGYPHYSALEAGVTVPLRGLPARLTLGGTMEGEGYLGLAAVPYAALTGADLPVAFDVPFAPTFSVSLDEAPPADADQGSDPDWRWTVHMPVLYTTTDWSTWDGASACSGDDPVYVRYTRPVTTYRGYRFLDCYDGNVGWRVARSDPEIGTVYLASAAAAALSVGPGCPAF